MHYGQNKKINSILLIHFNNLRVGYPLILRSLHNVLVSVQSTAAMAPSI